MPLATGQTLSFYEILGPLGAGGMGEVYRARDTRLEREVAIKVLPEELAADPERLRRFRREAKILASLNHPHVAGIHGVDQDGDVYFLALELVPGKDLSTRLAKGPLPVDEALDVCRQIAEGLEAAHESGVVHRDLKPANVRVTPEGVVKILDFGLAKPIRSKVTAEGTSSAEPDSILATEEGLLMGTPTYMSPEQARGKPVDRRTDIWAFGCVLYECLTGARAFGGSSVPEILAAVLERGWDRSRLPAATPAHVRELLERCLDKDPRQRLRDVGEARIALDGIRAGPRVAKPGRGVPRALVLILALVLAMSSFLVGGWRTTPTGPANPLDRYTPRKLIDWPGTEFDAAIDREGKWLAFASDRDGQFDAWAGLIDGTSKNMTNGGHPVWSLKVRDVYFDLSGNNLCLSGGLDKQTMFVEKTGGRIRKFPWGTKIHETSWSHDGNRVVYHSSDSGDAIIVAEADGSDPVSITDEPHGVHQHYTIWSTDDEWIYFVRGRPASREMHLWRISPDGKIEEQLTADLGDVGYPTPIDPNTVLFVALDENGAGPWLWALDVESRTTIRAAIGMEQYMSIAASLDGTRLVATVANPIPHLWNVRIPGPEEGVVEGNKISRFPGLEIEYGAAPRYGGEGSLFFLSSGSVRRLRDGQIEVILPASEAAALVPPAVSPVGQTLAVVSTKRGQARLKIVSADGVLLANSSDTVQVLGAPTWSNDGKSIAIGGRDDRGNGLFLFPFDGAELGQPERIVEGYALSPIWSPTEDLIVYGGDQTMAEVPMKAVRSNGEPVEFPDIRVIRMDERMRFLPDGSGLIYMKGLRMAQDFWLLDLTNLETPELWTDPRQLTILEGIASIQTMRTFDIDPSGESIVFDRLDLNSDIILFELDKDADR